MAKGYTKLKMHEVPILADFLKASLLPFKEAIMNGSGLSPA